MSGAAGTDRRGAFAAAALRPRTALPPGIDLRTAEGNRETLLQLLQDNAIDLALMGRPPRELDAVSGPIAAHPYVLVASPRHPLRDEKRFDLQELRHETILLRECTDAPPAFSG